MVTQIAVIVATALRTDALPAFPEHSNCTMVIDKGVKLMSESKSEGKPSVTKKRAAGGKAVVKKSPAKKSTVKKSAAGKTVKKRVTTRKKVAKKVSGAAGKKLFSARDRYEMIAKMAYFRAEKRGFEPGWEQEDWLESEKLVDDMLSKA